MSKNNLSVINVKRMDLDDYGRSEITEIMSPELLEFICGGSTIDAGNNGCVPINFTICL